MIYNPAMTAGRLLARATRLLPAVLPLMLLAGCGPSIDIKQTLAVTDLSGGWYDAGIKDGKNKLVPSLTFRITKNIEDDVRPLSLNIAFKRLTGAGEEDFDDVYLQSVEFQGNETAPVTVRPETGYTGDPPQTRAQMLENSEFKDMRAIVFAKHSSSNWVELARFDLPRTLITK
jgi:hypothetical protein